MRKEKVKHVEKVWGEEIWLVNSPKYCGKLLMLEEGARGSYHYHKEKEETFFCLEGNATLVIEGKVYALAPYTSPKTILAGEKHCIEGLTNAVILEISTTHSEDDVVRLNESVKGHGGNEYARMVREI